MKTTLALTISCLLSFTLLAQQSKEQKPSKAESVRIDSLAVVPKSWEVRRPFTHEEEQRRADNRAELESMKARFRAYHEAEGRSRDKAAAEAEDGEYLWSASQPSGALQPKGTAENPNAPSDNTEELRMEIGRNLQEGRSMSIPAEPVRPKDTAHNMPTAYDYPISTAPPVATKNWEADIRSSLQGSHSPSPVNDQWQARGGVPVRGLVDPHTGEALQAGQTLILTQVQFANLDATLSPNTQDILLQWAKTLLQNPQLVVQVRAHTHSGVPTFEAQQLTNRRATAIVDFWHQQGVLSSQVSYRGDGRLSPLVSSADPQAQQKNERIELVILEMP